MAFKIELHKEVTQVTTYQDTSLGVMRWGRTNSFPQTLKNLIEQSPLAKHAVDITAKFYRGESFEDENTIVSSYGLTLKDVVAIIADDLSTFKSYALQCNYNAKGVVTGINPIRITDLRFNEFDELNFASQVGYFENYGNNSEVHKTVSNHPTKSKIKWLDKFNPNAVKDQVNKTEGGLSNYQGQVLYYSEAGHSSYPIPPLQAPINYLLADVENSILVRKETSTGFINSYILKTMLPPEDPTLTELEYAIEEAQGARGSGKIITFAGLSPEEMQSTVLEEIGSGSGAIGIIKSATMSYELCQKVINGAYHIPPILAGADQKTGFSAPDLRDGYFVFNAVTQDGRDAIESGLNRVLENSVFNVKVKLNKLHLDDDDDQREGSERKTEKVEEKKEPKKVEPNTEEKQ